MNRLYYGDCLTIVPEWPSASVDLIYLDPPFNSNRQYNAIYKDETGRPLPDQIEAFCDMWELDEERERAIRTMPVLMRESGIDDEVVEFWRLWMQALRGTQPRLLAYLSYMAQRLLIMKRVLKPTGSLYFHCDPTASHYVKVLLDAVFGHENFRNEAIWRRVSAHNSAKRWGPIHDTLLFYSRSDYYHWNRTLQPHDKDYLESHFRSTDDHGSWQGQGLTGPGTRQGESGQPWREIDPTDQGRHWAVPTAPAGFEVPPGYGGMTVQQRLDALDALGLIYWPPKGRNPRFKQYLSATQGVPLQDIVWLIPPINSQAAERMGYATQKPIALLERIIKASSNPGDVVLDPFCGCATTLEAAHRLDRKWIGIDIAIHAVKRVARIRLAERLGLVEGQDFTIEGGPLTVEGAQDLWERDKYHFQKWAVEQVEGFVTTKRSADGGIDGRVYFAVPHAQELQSMVIEVKGGANVPVTALRALKGVLDYDTALMAGLITMRPIRDTQARNFKRFMADAGTLEILGIEYPRMQILSVGEILQGKRFHTPTVSGRHMLEPGIPGLPR